MLPTPFPGNGKSRSKAQNPEPEDSFSSVFLWAGPRGRRWLVSKTVALSRLHVLLATRGSASWAGREIWCAAGKFPIPLWLPELSWSALRPWVLLPHCPQEFGILARAEAFFPAATIQPHSVRLARGGRSAPGGDLAVRGGRGQPAFVSCFARGFWGKSRGTQSPAFAWAPWAGWLRLPLCAPQAASSLAGLRTLGCARPRAKSVNTCWGERLSLQRPFLCPAVMGLMFRGCLLPEYVFPGMRSLLLAERTVKIRKESSKVSWDRSRGAEEEGILSQKCHWSGNALLSSHPGSTRWILTEHSHPGPGVVKRLPNQAPLVELFKLKGCWGITFRFRSEIHYTFL